MTTEEAFKAEMRLVVLETLVTMLYGMQHIASGNPKESLAKLRSALIERARNQAFPELGAEYSDAAAAELEMAADAALRAQERLLRPLLGPDR